MPYAAASPFARAASSRSSRSRSSGPGAWLGAYDVAPSAFLRCGGRQGDEDDRAGERERETERYLLALVDEFEDAVRGFGVVDEGVALRAVHELECLCAWAFPEGGSHGGVGVREERGGGGLSSGKPTPETTDETLLPSLSSSSKGRACSAGGSPGSSSPPVSPLPCPSHTTRSAPNWCSRLPTSNTASPNSTTPSLPLPLHRMPSSQANAHARLSSNTLNAAHSLPPSPTPQSATLPSSSRPSLPLSLSLASHGRALTHTDL